MNKIEKTIKSKEHQGFVFRANKIFYEVVGINRKRWGQIYRGDIYPTTKEVKAIAQYFEVDITELI